jgi:hypothetical protein
MVKRYFGRLLEPVPVLKALAAATVVYLLLSLPRTYSPVVLPFACIAGMGLYFAIMLAVRAISIGEVKALFRKDRDEAVPEGIDEGI